MRYNNILKNRTFLSVIDELESLEKNRKYCKHGITHLFDVARCAYIINLENNLNISKDIIYATALLHDMGRARQYKYSLDHHTGGLDIVENILVETGYSKSEIEHIKEAVACHGTKTDTMDLKGIIYMADKLSRPCVVCKAEKDCDWSEEKKNFNMRY